MAVLKRARRSRIRSVQARRTLVALIVVALLVPAVANGWTLRRYHSGYTLAGYSTDAITDSYLDRQYNRAYHDTADGWRVAYFKSGSSTPTWEVVSYSSPTSQGLTTGPRQAYCQLLDPNTSNTAYNCDTTVP